MKKMFLALAAFVLGAAMMSAQDLASATETYNAGAEALGINDKAGALNHFKEALNMGLALGEEGAELVANCKSVIPGLILSIGKEYYNAKDFDTALEKVNEALAIAKEYENEEIAIEAESLVGQVTVQKNMAAANDAFKAKDFATAATGFKEVLALDPDNKNASIRLVQALANAGDLEAAKEALATATANGKEEDAKKVLGGAFLKKAAAAIAAAEESLQYDESSKAYQIAGQASYKAKKNADAIKYFEKYLELDPQAKNAGQIALTVGALYQGQGDKAKALEFYKKAQALGEDTKAYIDALSK